MKRILLLPLLTLVLLTGCVLRVDVPDLPAETTAPPAPTALWERDELPVRVKYDRMWEYSASAETEDPAAIDDLVRAIQDIELGGADDMVTEDYTDILTFTFADGSTQRFEFEYQNYVAEGGTRYHADGLGALRSLLDDLLGDEIL